MPNIINVLQIGSHVGNTGNDPLFSKNTSGMNIILIEPVPYLFEYLKKNYKEKEKDTKIQYLNIAVSNKDDTLELYIPSDKNDFTNYPFWASQLASVMKDHVVKHIPNLIVDKHIVPCKRLNTIIKEQNIGKIEYLLIDTEGHDYEILMDLDLSILKPENIIFENKHMDGTFVRGDRYNSLLNYFISNGYELVSYNGEDTHIHLKN